MVTSDAKEPVDKGVRHRRGRTWRHGDKAPEPVKVPTGEPAEVKFKHVSDNPVILEPIPRTPR